jgi:hypothetical protein
VNSVKNRVIFAITYAKNYGGLKVNHIRTPYTYHHDYIRIMVNTYNTLSRSDIGCLGSNEDELYAGMLMYLIVTDPISFIISGITGNLVELCLKISAGEIKRIDVFYQTLNDMQYRNVDNKVHYINY